MVTDTGFLKETQWNNWHLIFVNWQTPLNYRWHLFRLLHQRTSISIDPKSGHDGFGNLNTSVKLLDWTWWKVRRSKLKLLLLNGWCCQRHIEFNGTHLKMIRKGKTKLNEHFARERNVIFEHAKFDGCCP